jgi:hypothetical protein
VQLLIFLSKVTLLHTIPISVKHHHPHFAVVIPGLQAPARGSPITASSFPVERPQSPPKWPGGASPALCPPSTPGDHQQDLTPALPFHSAPPLTSDLQDLDDPATIPIWPATSSLQYCDAVCGPEHKLTPGASFVLSLHLDRMVPGIPCTQLDPGGRLTPPATPQIPSRLHHGALSSSSSPQHPCVEIWCRTSTGNTVRRAGSSLVVMRGQAEEGRKETNRSLEAEDSTGSTPNV